MAAGTSIAVVHIVGTIKLTGMRHFFLNEAQDERGREQKNAPQARDPLQRSGSKSNNVIYKATRDRRSVSQKEQGTKSLERRTHGYGTRSTAKGARGRVADAANPLSLGQSNIPAATAAVPATAASAPASPAASRAVRHGPSITEAPAPPLTTYNGGREALNPPPPSFVTAEGGQQQCNVPIPAKRESLYPAESYSGLQRTSAPMVVPPAIEATRQLEAENLRPAGRASGGDGRRKRSRLSLKRRISPCRQNAATAPLAPIFEGTGDSSSCAPVVGCFPGGVSPRLSEGCVSNARFAPPKARPYRSPPPPLSPPFVGLENMGETCYVNAVLQALAACRKALKSTCGARKAAVLGYQSKESAEGDEMLGPSPSAPQNAAGDDSLLAQGASTNLRLGTNGNPVVDALGKILGEMETSNDELLLRKSAAAAPQTALTAAVVPGQLSPPNVNMSGTANEGGSSKQRQSSDLTPLRSDAPTSEGPGAGAITPTALVELIRDGWLSAKRSAGVGAAGRFRVARGAGDPAAVADFGTGQACVSELLGKLLDVSADDDTVPNEDWGCCASRGGVAEREGDGSIRDLSKSFCGALCSLTRCVECERGRTSREDFTELTLPPLVLPPPRMQRLGPQSPSHRPVATHGAASAVAGRHQGDLSPPGRGARTLQGLVDAMLGREAMEGNNKVWCEACRQWNEAERKSLLCSSPRVLALHVRPGARKRVSPCPYPAAAIAAAGVGAFAGEAAGPGGVVGGGEDWRRTGRGRNARDCSTGGEELIERVLEVKSAARCRSHAPAASLGCGPATGAPVVGGRQHQLSEQRGKSSCDVSHWYDLVGCILHQGPTFGSGHYTFVLNVGGPDSGSGDQASAGRLRHHHRPPPAKDASGATAETEHAASPPAESSMESPEMLSVQGLDGDGLGSGWVEGEAGGPFRFVLFDDAVVRYLTAEEESNVVGGGGAGLGDPFLMFYARRP